MRYQYDNTDTTLSLKTNESYYFILVQTMSQLYGILCDKAIFMQNRRDLYKLTESVDRRVQLAK